MVVSLFAKSLMKTTMLKRKNLIEEKTRWWAVPGVLAALSLVSTPLSAETAEELAMEEYEAALQLEPDLENGRQLYEQCAVCHDPEGWGRRNGVYPQIAGQLPNVIIKQLADIRAGNRGNPMMYPFASGRILKDAQDIADVSAYVAQLPMTWDNGRGSRSRARRGEELYATYCADCHGEEGEGNNEDHVPAIQGQHYEYLVRQFDWIRIGRRMNADEDMVEQIRTFHSGDMYDVLSYTSYLEPPEEKLAPDGWYNPDFPRYSRDEDDQYRSRTLRLSVQEREKEKERKEN